MNKDEKILADINKEGNQTKVDLTFGSANVTVKWDITDVEPMVHLVMNLSEYVANGIEALLEEAHSE